MANQPLIFIAGTGRCGSTMLDLMLGAHEQFIGLGEVHKALAVKPADRDPDAPCSCGATAQQCPFWAPIGARLKSEPQLSLPQRYQLVFDTFGDLFGDGCIPVDSSKNRYALNVVSELPGVDLKVIHMIRDVRGYVVSTVDHRKRRRFDPTVVGRNWKERVPLIQTWPSYHFWWWYLANRRLQKTLRRGRIEHLQIGYEELCLQPDEALAKLCAFLGVEPSDDMRRMQVSKSHIIRGNTMRNDASRRSELKYDDRWRHRRDWRRAAALFPHIMRYNRQEVYRHLPAAQP